MVMMTTMVARVRMTMDNTMLTKVIIVIVIWAILGQAANENETNVIECLLQYTTIIYWVSKVLFLGSDAKNRVQQIWLFK